MHPRIMLLLPFVTVCACGSDTESNGQRVSPETTPTASAAVGTDPAPTPASPPTVVVASVSDCHEVDVPEHGSVPRPDDVRVTRDAADIVVTITNAHAACPDAPTLGLVSQRGQWMLEVTHHSPGPSAIVYQALYRDLVVRLRGLPTGVQTIGIRNAEDSPDAPLPLFDIPPAGA